MKAQTKAVCAAVLLTLLGVSAPNAAPKMPIGVSERPQLATGGGDIRITAEIPQAPGEMQLFRLAPTAAPVQFLEEQLKAAKLPGLKIDKPNYIVRSAAPGSANVRGEPELVRAYIDLKSGDTEFIPNMAELIKIAQQVKPLAVQAFAERARAIFADPRFMPKDATELRLAETITVMGGASGHGAGAPAKIEPITVMTMVPAVRYAAGLPVFGLGSHALVTFANDATIAGAVRHWRTATAAERVKSSLSPAQVRDEILRQLKPLVSVNGSSATVDKIELAYYDNDRAFLQPVYHFEATVVPGERRISPIRASGFIAIGQPREPIPDLAAPPTGEPPATPKAPRPGLRNGGIGLPPTPDDITLGEYANIDWHADSGYVSMSNNFLSGLTSYGWTPPVTRTQWYEAHSWEVVGPSSRYYLNAVQVAYTVPHGDWLINSTDRNCCDPWYVPDIGTGGNPGFGAAAGGGTLATWIIMSCEVLPSFYDRQNEIGGSGNGYDAFNAWWPVFQGLHNVIAFRTIMFYPDNALQYGFGRAASLGGDLNATWFQQVAAHEGGRGSYASGHLIGGRSVHYDRASTMIDQRNLGSSIFSVAPQSASSTLWNFWMGD